MVNLAILSQYSLNPGTTDVRFVMFSCR